MRRTLKRAARDSKGAAAVEFAMVILPFIYMIFAAIDLAMMFSAWSTVQWACDSAARQIMVSATQTSAQAVINAKLLAVNAGFSNGNSSTITFTSTMPKCGSSTLDCIVINGSFTYAFKLTTLGKGSVTLTARAYAPLVP